MYTAKEIAEYVIGYYSMEKQSYISNLKLQKVMYFLQANHLVSTGRKLFDEKIEAVSFGPVIKSVYKEYMIYGSANIPYHKNTYKLNILNNDQKDMNELLDELEPYSSNSLLEIIFHQTPWEKAYYNHGKLSLDKNYGVREIKDSTDETLREIFTETNYE